MSKEAPSPKRQRTDNSGGSADVAAAAVAANNNTISNDWMSLNVSGTKILTKRSTLTSVPGSMLACMFSPDSPFGFDRDASGALMLDRDAEAFLWILGVLRRGGAMSLTCPPPKELVERIRGEADFFGLDDIVRTLDEGIAVEHKCVTDFVLSNKTFAPGEGWTITSVACTPAGGSNSAIFRTMQLERTVLKTVDSASGSATSPSSEDEKKWQLRLNAKHYSYKVASFSPGAAPFSALATLAVPLTMTRTQGSSVGLDPGYELDPIAGRVLIAERGGGCSFFEMARFAQEAGAVALLISHHDKYGSPEAMGAPVDADPSEIRIPVLMTSKLPDKILNGQSVVRADFGKDGAIR